MCEQYLLWYPSAAIIVPHKRHQNPSPVLYPLQSIMDGFIYYLCCFVSFGFICYKVLYRLTQRDQPPSPFALPILGHLHLLKSRMHHTLLSLSHQYGPVFLLRFGYRNALIVSSPSVVEECFTKNDIVLANRPTCIAGVHLGQNHTSINWSPYGQHWRNLRRIAATEIFSSNRVLMSACFRQEEVKCLIKQLFVQGNSNVDLKSTFFELMFNLMNRMVAGEQCLRADMRVDEREKLKEAFKTTFVTNMSMNMVDFFPVLKWFPFLGLEKTVVELQRSREKLLQALIDDGLTKKKTDGHVDGREETKMRTLWESFLSIQRAEPKYYTDQVIKGIVTLMFTAGTDTTASTMEWAMSLLLNHPDMLEKAREEINLSVQHDRLLEDSDLSKLPYLHCIINETLRLHPVTPLLVPHAASEDCVASGYRVKSGTMLLVNAWGIHRDPKVWVEPNRFNPERFLVEGEKDGFKFIPFGVGRRGCPGAVLAMRTMALALGTLIQCFEWERMGQDFIDMSEHSGGSAGTAMSKSEPLEAICRPRKVMLNLLSQL